MPLSVEDKQRIKRAIAGVYPMLGRPSNRLSVILNYHSIHETLPAATRPDDFTAQMEYLKEHFTVLPLAEFQARRTSRRGMPARAAAITFDDGYRDNHDIAYPVLKRLGLPATIFVTTGYVNGEAEIGEQGHPYRGLTFLDWSQIREMGGNGISFGAHTHSHPILADLALDEAEREIVRSKRVLEEELGEPVSHFAYPLGAPRTFNSAIIELLKKHRFELACSTLWGADNSATDSFSLHRVRIDACDTLQDFINKISGRWDFVRFFQTLRG